MLLVTPAALAAQEPPAIERQGDSVRVVLTAQMQEALERHFARFRHWQPADYVSWMRVPENFNDRQAMSVVLADLNGDGVEDVALAGQVEDMASVLFALVSYEDRFTVVEIHRDRLSGPVGAGTDTPLGTYMRHVAAGHYEASCWTEGGRPELHLDHSALAVSWAEKATSIFYYEDGVFEWFAWHTC